MILLYIYGIELLQISQFKLYATGTQNYKYSYFCLTLESLIQILINYELL